MFMLLGSNEKKVRKEAPQLENMEKVKELFGSGRFPVVTTEKMEGRSIAKVLGLVCCRGFDSEEAFFGMANMALKKGAQSIVGYSENVAFHPDGSKYFSCFGTAVVFEREGLVREPREVQAEQREPRSFSRTVSRLDAQPDEDNDPVLQRLLAAPKRQQNLEWQ